MFAPQNMACSRFLLPEELLTSSFVINYYSRVLNWMNPSKIESFIIKKINFIIGLVYLEGGLF